MDLDSNTKECTLVLTWAESLHTNRGAMETTGRRRGWRGGGVGERWLTTSIPLQIVLKCTYRCRRLQNHPTMQTPFFYFFSAGSLRPEYWQTHTHTCKLRKGESPAILALNSSDFLFSSLPCIPPCIVPASDGSRPYSWKQESQQEQKEGWGKALSKPPLSIVSLLSLLCFFFPWVFPFLVACVQEEGKNCKSP